MLSLVDLYRVTQHAPYRDYTRRYRSATTSRTASGRSSVIMALVETSGR
ncbi:hypothetical protein [Sorangium sp. So ce1153]